MELNKISLSDFTALADIKFIEGAMSLPREARDSGMFKVMDIPDNTGESRKFSEVDIEEYAEVKGESDQAGRAKVQQGYTKTMTVQRFAKDIGISYEMRKFNKYPEVVAKLTNLGQMADNRLELDMQHRLTFGESTTYTNKEGSTVDLTCGDTFALYYTLHALAGSSTTFRNILANNPQLSRGSLEAMELMRVQNTYNHMGEKKVMKADILWTSEDPNTVNTALEYLKSTASPDATHAGVTNVYAGKYRHVILSRLATTAAGANDSTKAKRWGLASSQYSTAMVGIWERPHMKAPSDLNAGEEFSTDDWNFGTRAGWGIAILNAGWISVSYGNQAA